MRCTERLVDVVKVQSSRLCVSLDQFTGGSSCQGEEGIVLGRNSRCHSALLFCRALRSFLMLANRTMETWLGLDAARFDPFGYPHPSFPSREEPDEG